MAGSIRRWGARSRVCSAASRLPSSSKARGGRSPLDFALAPFPALIEGLGLRSGKATPFRITVRIDKLGGGVANSDLFSGRAARIPRGLSIELARESGIPLQRGTTQVETAGILQHRR